MTSLTAPAPAPLELIRTRAAEIAARAQWPAERRQADRRARLRALLAHAVAKSPYYREVLGGDIARGDVALAALPTLSKQTLMREFDRIVTDPALHLAELEAHVAGPAAGTSFSGSYRVFATSGSSGFRAVIVHSEDEFTTWIAAHLPFFARNGIGPSTRLATIGAPSPIHLSKQLFAAFQQNRDPAPALSVLTPLDEAVEALQSFRPDALIGYSSIIASLAQEQLDGRLRIEPHLVLTGAELLAAEMEQRIVAAWGSRPVQVYATTEAPIVAAGGLEHRELSIFEDLVWIEVVDEQTRPVPAGTPGYKVLLTNLVNHAQPLIRYELTDAVTLAPNGGIASIDGRSDDTLLLPGEHGKPVAVPPYRLRAPFLSLKDVRTYQLVHDGDSIDARVVLQPNAPHATLARVRQALLATLDAAGAAVPLRVTAVTAIEREGHAAKVKLIKRVGLPADG
jgi:phenylacetate-CoA ligase